MSDVTITLSSRVLNFSFEELGIEYDSPEGDVLAALRPMVLEEEGIDVVEDDTFMVKYMDNEQQLSVFPKSTAG